MGKMRKITIFDILNYTWFALFTLVCFFPFYYLLINTISNNDLSSRGLIMFYPRGLHINNYIDVFRIPGLGTAALVSIGRTVIGTLLTVAASGFLGYLFTKNAMWGRKFWYRFLIVTMYFNAGLIPWYLIMLKLGLVNNFLAYVIPGIVAPFNIILVKTFIESTPIALQESAQIDGAGFFTIFLKIVMPLITPILATIAIFSAIGQWNSFQDTLFLITNSKLFTLQFLLYRYLNEATSLATLMKSTGGAINADLTNMQTATSIRTTVSMVVVIPILLVYPFFQRYFVKGILIGAVKG
ncbi:putative aldouronate transport system permease protein [Paenibacillus sp. V4I3]|uniref:carbohydrate ABC transporter permease n=1 Tax=unclassified Paenibacillus TaxID=185978 RepID=UPI000647CA1A|nr:MULTISPECIES: carbohydrate ABC transporter permease [unclassified Paenibacillus]MDQ0877753.1 putative aldouronate transport system permease protein [Paenibacillus sp. V4I3]MDQ0886373.1 putative aldouronate transport system permease protein [Paenibacillus sp. V4I9]